MTVRLIQEFLEGASAKSTLQRYFPASEPDMSWIRRRAERTAIVSRSNVQHIAINVDKNELKYGGLILDPLSKDLDIFLDSRV